MGNSTEDFQSKREEALAALNVTGYHGFLDFDDDIFLMDFWNVEDGINYLIGIKEVLEISDGNTSTREIITLEHDFYFERDQPHITSRFELNVARLLKLWNSGMHNDFNTPSYYIEWAISKKHKIPWLKYATEKGFYNASPQHSVTTDKYDGIGDDEMFDLAFGVVASSEKERYEELHPRTKNNYLRLILALANGIKGFNPKKPHEAASLIINETGIENLSAEAIAKYISEAYQLESKKRD